MAPLLIEETETTPGVILDPVNMKFEISGESRPEQTEKFYMPIINWLEQYESFYSKLKAENGQIAQLVLALKLSYFNSSSSKYILSVAQTLDKYFLKGYDVKIQWYYDKRDEDMKDSGEEFAALLKLPFEFIAT